MSIIIRLQNLPWSANALDIRQFFSGLQIPEGGVHIVGGELGDAFIAFSTDEDARQAFLRTDGKIKGIQIKLMLSSRTEMQRVIEQARTQSMAAFMLPTTPPVVPAAVPAIVPAAVPEMIVKDTNENGDSRKKRDRRRSRSKSRDRSRDRRRHRSRSKSRDRRRKRTRSRNRSRDRAGRRTDGARSSESVEKKVPPQIWSSTPQTLNIIPPVNLNPTPPMLGASPWGIEPLLKPSIIPNINGAAPFGGAVRQPWSIMNRPPLMIPINNWTNQQQQQDNRNRGGRKSRFEDSHMPVNACVSLEPFYGSYGDLRKFFAGLNINYKGIKVINDEVGNKTGVCFVQFRDDFNKSKAIQMDGLELNGTEVKIRHIADKLFDQAVDRFNPRKDDSDDSTLSRTKTVKKFIMNKSDIQDFLCLKIDDLPSFVTDQDVLHIFPQHSINSLKLRGSTAYVKFNSKEDAKVAYDQTTNPKIRGKTVTVQPCLDMPNHDDDTDCLFVKNFPSKTTDRDISDFFSDIGVVPNKIHLMSNRDGFTGQAYCEFDSAESATKAATKNNSSLGPATIVVESIPRNEMEKKLNTFLPHPGLEHGQTLQPGTPLPPVKPKIEEQIEIDDDDDDDHDNEADVIEMPKPQFPRFPRGGMRGGFRGRGGRFPHGMHHFPLRFESPPMDEECPPGCTVYMDNVPYKAGTNEILDFFDGYNCTNNVSRRYNPDNTPSAEAKVTFFSPDEAFNAVRDLNGKSIWTRRIRLRQS